MSEKADPKLAKLKDDDGRLPIHWACSANQKEIVQLLIQNKFFDVDVQVCYGYPRPHTYSGDSPRQAELTRLFVCGIG